MKLYNLKLLLGFGVLFLSSCMNKKNESTYVETSTRDLKYQIYRHYENEINSYFFKIGTDSFYFGTVKLHKIDSSNSENINKLLPLIRNKGQYFEFKQSEIDSFELDTLIAESFNDGWMARSIVSKENYREEGTEYPYSQVNKSEFKLNKRSFDMIKLHLLLTAKIYESKPYYHFNEKTRIASEYVYFKEKNKDWRFFTIPYNSNDGLFRYGLIKYFNNIKR